MALFKIILKLFAVSLQIMFKKFACVVDNDLPRLTSHVKFGSTELCELRVCRGRNFGLKSGGTDSEFRRRTRRPWVPRDKRKGEFWEVFPISLPSDLGLGEQRELSEGFGAEPQPKNGFIVI